jgi:hypothetical protein
MFFPFSHLTKDDFGDEHPLVVTHERPAQNTSEGSEFLDDALRMEDFSPARTEEIVAAGAPENLL